MKNNLYTNFFFRNFLQVMFFVCFCLNSGKSFGQTINEAIRIYLTDAETGKNVKDARVTLEGFEIPAIEGKYNKKGRYYYFTEIPKGYNTVMSYHKNYNEKGFQDVNGLPAEVKLKLYDPLNVSYQIYKFPDSMYIQEKNKYINSKFFRDIYVEDPYKISINIVAENCEKVIEKIEKLNSDFDLGIETLNPYYLSNHTENSKFNCSDVIYPYKIYPMANGLSNEQVDFIPNDSPSVFLRKKDGSKFKRFNDSVIKKLRDNEIFTESIIYLKEFYREEKLYKNSYTKLNDKKRIVSKELKSKVELYKNIKGYKIFFLLPISYQNDDLIDDKSLGLGVLDELEYYALKYKTSFENFGKHTILIQYVTFIND